MGNLTGKAYEGSYYGDDVEGIPLKRFITLMKFKVREWNLMLKKLEKEEVGETDQEQLNMLLRDSHLLLQEFMAKGISFTQENGDSAITLTTTTVEAAPTEQSSQTSQDSMCLQVTYQPSTNSSIPQGQRLPTRTSSSSSCQGLLYNKQSESVSPISETKVQTYNDQTDEVFVIDKAGFPNVVNDFSRDNNKVKVTCQVHTRDQHENASAMTGLNLPKGNNERLDNASGLANSESSGSEQVLSRNISNDDPEANVQLSKGPETDKVDVKQNLSDTDEPHVTIILPDNDSQKLQTGTDSEYEIGVLSSNDSTGSSECEMLTTGDDDICHDPISESPSTKFTAK